MPADNPNGIVPATKRESASIFGQIPTVGDKGRPEVAEPARRPEPVEAVEAEAEESVEVDEVEGHQDESDTSEVFVVRVDGEEVEVPLDELLSGYSRQADYTRKTQALSAEKKQFEAERQQAQQLAQALQQRLQEVDSFLSQSFQEPDWAELSRQLSPQEYNQARAVYEQQQKQVQAVRAQRTELERMQAMEMERQLQAARARLPQLIPDWANEEVANREAQAIYQYALDTGFSQEALENLYDPLAVKVLRDAWRYSELQKQKPQLVQRKAPKSARPGPGMQTKTNRQRQAEKALKGPIKAKEAADFFGNVQPIGARK